LFLISQTTLAESQGIGQYSDGLYNDAAYAKQYEH
jgi:hypothetical protein